MGATEQRKVTALAQDALVAIGLNGGEMLTLECLWRLAVRLEEREPARHYFIPGFLRVPISLDMLARWRRKNVRTIQLQIKKFDTLGFFRSETREMNAAWQLPTEAVEAGIAPGEYVIGPLALVTALHQYQDVRDALFDMQPDLYARDSYWQRGLQLAPMPIFGLPSEEWQDEMVRRSKAHFLAVMESQAATTPFEVGTEKVG
jgi:hypothetical protein